MAAETGSDSGMDEEYKIMMEQADPHAKALLDLMNETGYDIVQENGQRRYGGPPPDWNGRPPPPKGSEVFAGRIPRDCFEPELVPIFARIGKIYEMRLMMDFSGSNRGYAFVTYTSAADAIRAIIELNNYEIRKGKFIGVVKSVDNCRLFVGGIPRTKNKDEILNEMKRLTEGVVDVILYRAVADKTKSRGFAFVEYDSHKSAAMARRRLLPGKIHLWGNEIAVDWAEPEPEVDPATMSRVRALYFRNLMLDTTEDTLRDLCCQIRKNSVVKVKKMRDYAFVHFMCREDAEAVLEELNNAEIDGSVVELTWAKPVDRLIRNTSESRRSFGAVRRGVGFPARGGTFVANGAGGGGGDFGECTPYLLSPPNHAGQPYAPHWQALPVDHSLPQLVPFPAVVHGRFGPPVMSYSRGRGRGAGGLRNNYMATDYRNRTYDHVYRDQEVSISAELDHYSGIPTQVLHNLCQKHNLGEPAYQMFTGPMWRDHVTNRLVQLYCFKVTVPGIPGYYFQPTKYSANVEDARNFAAENILNIVFSNGHADAAAFNHGYYAGSAYGILPYHALTN